MITFMRYLTVLIYCAMLGMFVVCGSSSVADNGGNSSETTNGFVAGMVVYSSNQPVAGGNVLLRPAAFLADTTKLEFDKRRAYCALVRNGQTDDEGGFVVDSVDPDVAYVIEVRDMLSDSLACLYMFTRPDSIDTLRCNLQVIQATGKLKGVVTQEDRPTGAYLRIYGLERIAKSDPVTGKYSFEHLPPGTYCIEAVSPDAVCKEREVENVRIVSDSTTTKEVELCDD